MGIIDRIGTPLSNSATRVMLPGCGELGKEAIIALQRLGCAVTGVDRHADAPGMQLAHRSDVLSMTDGGRAIGYPRVVKPILPPSGTGQSRLRTPAAAAWVRTVGAG